MTSGKRTFLVCFDYDTGGIWGLVDAVSADQIRTLHPRLTVVEQDPPWLIEMTRAAFEASCERSGGHWIVGSPPPTWQRILDQK
jgi:hypothetical protein